MIDGGTAAVLPESVPVVAPEAVGAPSTAAAGSLPVGLTVGLLLAVTVSALESLTVLSVMPLVAADLDGLSLYGWVFAGFFLTSAVAIPVAAQVIDRSGLRIPFAAGLALFGVGLLVAGFAPSMGILVAGRFLQGTGAGTLSAVTYATVAIAYSPRDRGRVLALISTAWLVPAFVGPLLGSTIAQVAGWRWAFLGLAGFVPLAAVLVLPAVAGHDRRRVAPNRTRDSWTATLVPQREIGRAAVVSMLSGSAIWGVLTFAPLGMTEVRAQSTFDAGLGVGFCSVAWIAAAWVHQRNVDRFVLRGVIRYGLVFVTASTFLLLADVAPSVPFIVILAGWVLIGLGCGAAFQAINLYVMGRATPGTEGRATSSVQLANTIGAAVGTSALGVVFNGALGGGISMAGSLVVVFGACWVVLLLSTLLAWGIAGGRDRQADTTVA